MARLERRFGESYRDYAAVTRSLVPNLRPYPEAETRKWSLDLCLKENREQYFTLIVATIFAGIALRFFL